MSSNRKALKYNLIPTGLENTEGFQQHHWNRSFVISIPSFIHRSVEHSLAPGHINYGMIGIDFRTLNWLLGKW